MTNLAPVRETLTHVGSFEAGDPRLAQIIQEAGAPRRRQRDPRHLVRLAESARFLAEVQAGRVDRYHLGQAMQTREFHEHLFELYQIGTEQIYARYPVQGRMHGLQETLTTSDFPNLLTGNGDRQLLGDYEEWPLSWPNYARRNVVPNFLDVKRFALDGLDDLWYPDFKKPEMTSVQEKNNLTETPYSYHVDVYERGFSLNWRMLINDDLGAFTNLSPRLARGARRSEEYFVTTLFVDANGPHASVYTSGNANIVTGNPALSIAGLQTAIGVLLAQVDSGGQPIMIDMIELVVPPALMVIAQNILNATELRITEAGGTSNQQLIANNWMRNKVRLNVNPYIPYVASSANGTTSWFLFANPNASRPAIEVGFLRGFETPQIYQKAPDTMRVGGAVDPMLGDFETMELRYKGLHIFGGTIIDPKMTVASQGDGS